ncbi:MAG: hypothetical protein E6G92_10615 [Alphaproteobacteria bacterium]|nr:MAG: hypothetical protein E6G92_10615 [Alphaproteobacteria bacterium]
MKIVQLECEDGKHIEILEAVKGLSRNAKVFQIEKVPDLPSAEREFEDRAQAIAKWIRPRSNQPMRLETLEFVLNGGNTWFDQNGESDPALRNATGALSKALRKFAPWQESPLEILCDRQRVMVSNGPFKGRYQGTRYSPTPLGRRVRDILTEWGVLRHRAKAKK